MRNQVGSRLSAFCLAIAQRCLPAWPMWKLSYLVLSLQRAQPEPSAWPSEQEGTSCTVLSVSVGLHVCGGEPPGPPPSQRSQPGDLPNEGRPAPLGPWPEPGFSLTSLLPRRLPRSFQARSAAAQSRATRHLISEVPAQGSDRKVLLSWQRICAEELATLPSSSSRNIRSREQEGAWHSTKVPLCCMAPCLSVLLHNHIPKEGNRCSYSYWCRLVSLALAPEAQLDLLSFTNLVQSS